MIWWMYFWCPWLWLWPLTPPVSELERAESPEGRDVEEMVAELHYELSLMTPYWESDRKED